MGTTEKLMTVNSPTLGLVTEGPETAVPARAWRVAHNVRMGPLSVKNALGWSKFCEPYEGDGAPILLIVPQSDPEGGERVVVATGSYFYKLLATQSLSRLTGGPFVADLDNRWQADIYANTIYAANINNVIQKISPLGDAVEELTGAPNARHLIQFEGHLLTGVVIRDGQVDYQALYGSGLAGVGTGFNDWNDPDPASDAFLDNISEEGGQIVGLARNGAYALVQKELTSLLVSYVKLPLVYVRQEVPQKVGQFVPFSMAGCGEKGIVFVSRGGLHMMDAGGNISDIGVRVARGFLEDLFFEDRLRTYAASIKESQEFILAYSSKAAAAGPFGRAMIWNWQTDSFTTRSWPFTAIGTARVPSATLSQMEKTWEEMGVPWVQSSNIITWAGDADGAIHVYGNPDMTGNGTNLEATLESGLMDAGDPGRVKIWRDVVMRLPVLTGNPIMLSVGVCDSPEGALEWTTPQPVTGSGRYFVGAVGRFAKLRLTKSGGQFELSGYDMSVGFGGGY